MRIRNEYLEKARGVADSETVTVNIDVLNPISALVIVYQATNGATSNQGVAIHDDIDSIDLVDGSEEVFSLSGIEALILNAFEMKRMPYMDLTEAAGGVQKEAFIINFGRYIGDPDYWLDPTEFRNLQLRLAHSLTISATAGFATGSGVIDVIAKVFEEKPSGRNGYMIAKEQYSFTSGASGIETAMLPTDYTWRMLIQRAYESATDLITDVTNIKVNFDGGAYVPVDMGMLDILQDNANKLGTFEYAQQLLRTDGDAAATYLQQLQNANANNLTDLSIASVDDITANQVTLQVLDLTVSPTIAKATADESILLQCVGYAPFGSILVPLCDPYNDGNWLQVGRYSKAKLELTQGGAGAACQTILQQVRS